MTNREISDIFRAIGSLLQIRGDDAFRARIYDRAADVINKFPRELASETTKHDAPGYDIEAIQQLRATPGIGKAIEDKTVEMLETGRCKYYDNLVAEMGTGILGGARNSWDRCKDCREILSGNSVSEALKTSKYDSRARNLKI